LTTTYVVNCAARSCVYSHFEYSWWISDFRHRTGSVRLICVRFPRIM